MSGSICSTDIFFNKRCQELINFLVLRGYTRHETLKPRPQNNSDRAPFVITFNPALPNGSSIVRKHINILQSSAPCKETFSCPPALAYKRSPNLRDLLVRTKLRNRTKRQDKAPSGIYKCNHPRCLTCPFLQEGQNKYTFSATKKERHINDTLNCKSKNLIYLIECKKCAKQYIGETKRQLNERFGEHRHSILNHHHLINPTPVSTHFN